MPLTLDSLYPIFIKWMPFHIPVLVLMYSFIVVKLLNYFQLIQISFQLALTQQNKYRFLNIIVLSVLYLLVIVCVIWMYKKVLLFKMQLLKGTGSSTMQQYQKHVKQNTKKQLRKLQRDEKFLKWKRQKLQKQEHEKTQPKIIYQIVQSSSSDEQVQQISEHRLATSKKIF